MKNILVISWHFAPQNEIGAIRFTKMVKYLARTGEYHFWVICKEMDEKEIYDKILQRDMEEVSEYVTICPVHIDKLGIIEKIKSCILGKIMGQQRGADIRYSDVQRKLTSSSEAGINGGLKRIVGKTITFMNGIYLFMSNDIAFAKKGFKIYKHIATNNMDVMLSTWGPTGDILLGLKIKKDNKKIKWIMDYRDVCVASFQLEQIGLKYIAYKADKVAEYITGVNKQCNGSGKYMKKFHTIINGYDKEDIEGFSNAGKNDKLRIVYTGSIYDGRNLRSLFKILHELAEEKTIDPQMISVEYAGKDFRIIEQDAKEYSMENILVNRGMLPREKSLELQHEADILCVVTWNTEKEGNAITGKFIEYFMMEKPIFSIVMGNKKNSIVKRITDRANIGYSYEESSGCEGYLEAKQWISEKYSKFLKNGQIDIDPDEMYLDKFSSESMAKRFKRLIDG